MGLGGQAGDLAGSGEGGLEGTNKRFTVENSRSSFMSILGICI
jgi:hypothetical protein